MRRNLTRVTGYSEQTVPSWGGRQGAKTRKNRGWEAGEERAGSGRSKKAGIFY